MRILKFGGLIPIVLFSLIKHIEEDRYPFLPYPSCVLIFFSIPSLIKSKKIDI